MVCVAGSNIVDSRMLKIDYCLTIIVNIVVLMTGKIYFVDFNFNGPLCVYISIISSGMFSYSQTFKPRWAIMNCIYHFIDFWSVPSFEHWPSDGKKKQQHFRAFERVFKTFKFLNEYEYLQRIMLYIISMKK